jgi:CheY-like chemotaxis protein
MTMVLIVEDDPDVRSLQRLALECGGYDVTVATNGLEALQRLASDDPPCIILLDLMMPVMDGLTFLARRKTNPTLQEIPVVCVSAGGHDLMARARQLGAEECLAKSSDFDELCGVVGRYCSG